MYSSISSDHELLNAENEPKWRELLFKALEIVQNQVHPSLRVTAEALKYIERLVFRLLTVLVATQPHNVQDIENRVNHSCPFPINKWAIQDAQMAIDRPKKKSSLVFPVEKIHNLIIKEILSYKIEMQVTLYVVAVLEYVAADILKLTGNYVKNIKHKEISIQDIKVAMCADKVLMDMFHPDQDETVSFRDEAVTLSKTFRRRSLTYEEVVKDLLLEENQFIRDLQMLIKVFRQPFIDLFGNGQEVREIFSNVLDLYEFSCSLVGNIEDILEVTEGNGVPLVGACFEDMAEGAEFDVYVQYAEEILSRSVTTTLMSLLERPDTLHTLISMGHGIKDAYKFVLPKLLLGPVYHCLQYFEIIKALIKLSQDDKDQETLEQTHGVLLQLKVKIETKLSACGMRPSEDMWLGLHSRSDRQTALGKMADIQQNIDGWEGKDLSQICNEYLMEGTLTKVAGKKFIERYVFLLDGMIILTKPNVKRSSVSGQMGDYKLKEKYSMRKVQVVDKEDDSDVGYLFELLIHDHPAIVLSVKTVEEKSSWMAALITLQTRGVLDRLLDGILLKEEKAQPLRIPCEEKYIFAVKDSESNIVFEECRAGEIPIIKGGTLLKLVERLTYHTYADPKFLHTFLTTYRSFCTPSQLLTLLIKRFNIPDLSKCNADETLEDREDLKRFRKEYSKPIQFRVLNVLRHWVDQHWYDFESSVPLKLQLSNFLESVKGKALRKYVETIDKAIARRSSDVMEMERQITHSQDPPRIEWHISKRPELFEILTLHPIEIARQITLLEFDLYRAVKPSELVGSVWTKSNKNETSPNLLKMIHHSTVFSFWLEQTIIECANFEERVAVVCRIIEVMQVMQELNNFNGVLEIVCALNSAPIHRLKHTFEEIEHRYLKLYKVFQDAKSLHDDHFRLYTEKLRSINPPCVPFLGMYLTNIIFLEDGNPDFLPHQPEGIINFSKRQKVAEIVQEIQQYQNQPYCLLIEKDIRHYFENLKPLKNMTEKEFNDNLYAKSLEIEPRNSKVPPKFDHSIKEFSLKSPGVKPSSTSQRSSSMSTLSRHIPAALSSATSTNSIHRFNQPSDETPLLAATDGSSCVSSPPTTPSTPISPLVTGNVSSEESSVFVSHQIDSQSTHTADIPPPLPPRRRRESSGTTSPTLNMSYFCSPDYVAICRGVPPIPPRVPLHRRTSSRDHILTPPFETLHDAQSGISPPVHEIPVIPPRTYKHPRYPSDG